MDICFLQAYKREQRRKATKQQRCASSADSEVTTLRKALQFANKANQKLTATNNNLCRQLTEFKRMQISWGKQKDKLIQEKDCLQKTLESKYNKAVNEINRLETALEAAKSNREEADKRNEEMMRERQKEIEALKKKVPLQIKIRNNANEFEAECKRRWRLREEKLISELDGMQKKCHVQQEEIKKNKELISGLIKERVALFKDLLETSIQMHRKDDDHEKNEREWKIKYEALENRLREEQAEREQAEREQTEKVRFFIFILTDCFAEKTLKTCWESIFLYSLIKIYSFCFFF